MEFVNGVDLRTILLKCLQKESYIPIPYALTIIAECAKGLHYAHNKKNIITQESLGIIHRDISPQNIMVSFSGETKITDFGIAKTNNENENGVLKGKISYMSPEQVSRKAIDGRSDIFSLAIVMWEMLTTKQLFHTDNPEETKKLIKNVEIAYDLEALNPNIDKELKDIIYHGLEKNPDNRFKNAHEFEVALRKYIISHYQYTNPEDIGNFISGILSQRKQDLEYMLKQAVSDTNEAKSKQPAITAQKIEINAKNEGNRASAAKKQQLVSKIPIQKVSHQKSSSPIKTRGHPLSKRTHSYKKINISLWLLVFAAILIGVYISYSTLKKTSQGQIMIRVTPHIARISIDNKLYKKGTYLTFPQLIANIPLGGHIIKIERLGYNSKHIKLKVTADKIITKDITLIPTGNFAPVKIIINKNSTEKATVTVEHGLEVTMVTPNTPFSTNNLPFGTQTTMMVTPQRSNAKSFTCNFIPRSKNWHDPFIVSIDLKKQLCSYPAY